MPTTLAEMPKPELRRLSIVLVVGAIAVLLNTTMVIIALGEIANDLAAPISEVQWVLTAYLLAIAMVMPLLGWAVDKFGARQVWLTSLVAFTVSSALCAAAWSIPSLVAFRVLQGMSGGLVLPLLWAVLARSAGPQRLGQAMSLVAIPGQAVPILGPVAGGVVLGTLGWRWIFLSTVPIAVVALYLAWRALHADGRTSAPRLDRAGFLLLSPGLVLTLLGLAEAGFDGGISSASTALLLLVGGALLVAFGCRALIADKHTLVDLRLFRSRSFSIPAVLSFLFGVSIYGPMLLLPLYFQDVRGEAPVSTGLLLAPQGVGTMLALLFVGRLTDRLGPRPVVVGGLLLATLATAVFAATGPGASNVLLVAALTVRGAGLGAAGVPTSAAAYREIPASLMARASSAMSILQRLGASFGTAAIAIVLHQELLQADRSAAPVHSAYQRSFLWTVALSALTLLPALALPGSLRRPAPPQVANDRQDYRVVRPQLDSQPEGAT